MKMIFMGTPDFAVGTLEKCLEAGHQVLAVVTQPDKPKGRGKEMAFPPVKEVALKHGLTVLQPAKVREPEFVEKLRSYQPDVIVVVAFGQIVSKEILEIPRLCCVNVHASLLPKYRGASPIQWAVINGDKETGVTTMRMDIGIDTGDMIDKVVIQVSDDETGGSLFEKLRLEGAKLCVETLGKLEKGTAVFTKQDDTEASHVKMFTKAFGKIDWTKPALEIERLIRGLNPWPSAYTKWNDKTIKIWKATVSEIESHQAPGTVLTGRDKLYVQSGEGVLEIIELQLEGKKRMSADAFLRGYTIPEGTCF